MPWISRAELRRLLRQLARAEAQAESAQASLDIERHENRRSERHWSNMLLRARQMGGVPLLPEPRKSPAVPADEDTGPQLIELDAGELKAMVEHAADYGVSAKEAENLLRREKGLPTI